VLIFGVACVAALTACSSQAGAEQDRAVATSSPSTTPIPQIVLTSADLASCSVDPTKARVDEALSEETISPENSPLALPQEMGTLAKATTQMEGWKALSEPDRLFQICLNYQQGNFGTHTPAS
jgi:uncharacterized lipoprotein